LAGFCVDALKKSRDRCVVGIRSRIGADVQLCETVMLGADDLETELDRFRRKVEAGAQFAMTQALFDLAYFDQFEERLGGWPIPVMVGIFMVRSHQLAVRLHNEVPGIVVPEAVQARFRDAGPRGAEVGLELARELSAEAREKAAGVYVIPPFRQPEAALELLG